MTPCAVRVTARDRELFALLARARWLSTRQIQRRFFPDKSTNVVSKRLRKLVSGGYIKSVRRGFAEEQFHKLGRSAAQLLDDARLVVPRRLPVHLSHFANINWVRLALDGERQLHGLPLRGFWSESELKTVGHDWSVVPDGVAVVEVEDCVKYLAVEVDEGTENPRMVSDKLDQYRDAVRGDLFQAVLIYAVGWPRIRSLVRVLFDRDWSRGPAALVGDVTQLHCGSAEPHKLINLPELHREKPSLVTLGLAIGCPDKVSRRQDTRSVLSHSNRDT